MYWKCSYPHCNGAYMAHAIAQNVEDVLIQKFLYNASGKFLYNAIASTDNAQHENCPSSGIDDQRFV